jgi:uncharacterized membrane protein YraQ (UPF0718 family)
MKGKTIAKQGAPDKKKHSSNGRWVFMVVTLVLLGLVYVVQPEKGAEAGRLFLHLAGQILPMLLVVFTLMVLINWFLKTSTLVRYMGKGSGVKGWLVAIITGIVSMGAIYLWFPLLRDMMDKGVKPGLVATFLYNRGIKLTWLPLMVLYFGLKYVVVLTLVTVLASILQGKVIDLFVGKKDLPAG